MGVDGIGSSVIVALAAVLWLAYLVPTWLRRREYLATERNALRLQQTLRIMAETAEIPSQVRAEASARSVAQQELVLKKQRLRTAQLARAQDVADARAAARILARTQPAIAAEVLAASPASRRLRRSRAVTSSTLLAALITGGFGLAQFVATGVGTLFAVGCAVILGSVAMLGQMASVARTRAALAQSLRFTPARVARPVQQAAPTVAAVRPTSWTPVPVPKPLYLSKSQPQPMTVSTFGVTAEVAQAAADSIQRLREAQQAPEVIPIRAATASRFSRMGFIDAQPQVTTDLDAVLARRRA